MYESTPLYHDVRDLTAALTMTLVANTDILADLGIIKSGQQELKPDLDAKLIDLAAGMTDLRDVSNKQLATVHVINKKLVFSRGQPNINSQNTTGHSAFETIDDKMNEKHTWLYVLLSICATMLMVSVLEMLVWFIGYSLFGKIRPSLKANDNHRGLSFFCVSVLMVSFIATEVYGIWDSFTTTKKDDEVTNVYWGWLCYGTETSG